MATGAAGVLSEGGREEDDTLAKGGGWHHRSMMNDIEMARRRCCSRRLGFDPGSSGLLRFVHVMSRRAGRIEPIN